MKYLLALLLVLPLVSNAQRFFTRNGSVSFYSSTPVEDIEAHNTSTRSVMDSKSGAIQFAVLMKSFVFEKALMQEHFNENYVESDDYPKAIFKGKIANLEEVDFSKDGTYAVTVEGTMNMHGVEQPLTAAGTLKVEKGEIQGTSTFEIQPEDYNIEIPSVVRDKIAKTIKVEVDLNYKSMK
jgi:hypothetical protein